MYNCCCFLKTTRLRLIRKSYKVQELNKKNKVDDEHYSEIDKEILLECGRTSVSSKLILQSLLTTVLSKSDKHYYSIFTA